MKIKILNNQSLLDMALLAFGSAEYAVQLAIENNLSITDDLTPGQILTYQSKDYGTRQIAEYFQSNKINPATAVRAEQFETIIGPSGIDYWAIEVDFEVQ